MVSTMISNSSSLSVIPRGQSRLPPEVIEKIIKSLFHKTTPQQNSRILVTLLSVNKSFRNIILTTPSVWCNINIAKITWNNLVRRFFTRSVAQEVSSFGFVSLTFTKIFNLKSSSIIEILTVFKSLKSLTLDDVKPFTLVSFRNNLMCPIFIIFPWRSFLRLSISHSWMVALESRQSVHKWWIFLSLTKNSKPSQQPGRVLSYYRMSVMIVKMRLFLLVIICAVTNAVILLIRFSARVVFIIRMLAIAIHAVCYCAMIVYLMGSRFVISASKGIV